MATTPSHSAWRKDPMNRSALGGGFHFLEIGSMTKDRGASKGVPVPGTDFPRVAAVGTHHFPTALIESEKPTVVIQEIAARFLYSTAPADEPAVVG